MAEDQNREHDEQKRVQRTEQPAAEPESSFALENAPSYPTSLLNDPRVKGRGNGPVRTALMLQMQRTYGNRSVQRFLRQSANALSITHQTNIDRNVQRFLQRTATTSLTTVDTGESTSDEAVQLSLGDHNIQVQRQPEGTYPGAGRRFTRQAGSQYQLHLDPQIEAMMRVYVLEALDQPFDRNALLGALSGLQLGGITPTPASTGGSPTGASPPTNTTPPSGVTPTPGPAPSSGSQPSPNPGPATPRQAKIGDLIDALVAHPDIEAAWSRVKTRASSEFNQLGTGGKIALISDSVLIGGGAITGVLSDPELRKGALNLLNGRPIPLQFVARGPLQFLKGMHVELSVKDNDVMVGMHLDLSKYLPSSLGFNKSSSPQPLSERMDIEPPMRR